MRQRERKHTHSKERENERRLSQRSTNHDRRASLFGAARPSLISSDSMTPMSPADKLMFCLHKHFQVHEVSAVEEKANEIQNFLNVRALKEFSDGVKILTGNLLMARRLENTSVLEAALEALRKDVIITPASGGGRRGSVLKSCLRQSGEVKAQSPGERLEERLGPLLSPKIVDSVVYRADNIGSKEELDELIAYIYQQILDAMNARELEIKQDIAAALQAFGDQILEKELQMREMNKYMETMRRTVKLILHNAELEDETRSVLLETAKEIEADFNSMDDNEWEVTASRLHTKIEKLKAMTVDMIKSVPAEVALAIHELEQVSNPLLEELSNV